MTGFPDTSIFIFVITSAFIASAVICAVMRVVAPMFGFMDIPKGRKKHEKPVPLGGGFGILAGMVVAFGAFAIFFGEPTSPDFPFSYLLTAGIGALSVFTVGLVDDFRGLNPKLKLVLEVLIAAFLFHSGFRITVFVASPFVNFIITVLWLVLIINAFNLLDSHDGLSGSVALVITLMMACTLANRVDPFVALLLISFAGAVLGFLVHNFPPARLFMGDAGALTIGYFLGIASIAATFYTPDWGVDPLLAMVTPLLLFTVPLYDTATVVLIRLRSRKPLFEGDRNHLPHRLAALGLGNREVMFLVCLLTAATSAGAVYISGLSHSQAVLLTIQVLAILILLFTIERAGERK